MTTEQWEFLNTLNRKNITYKVLDEDAGILEVEGVVLPIRYLKTFTLVCHPDIFFKMAFDFTAKYWILYFSVDKYKWYHISGIKHNLETGCPDFLFQEGSVLYYRNYKDEIAAVYFEKYEDGIKTLIERAEGDSLVPSFVKHQRISKAQEPTYIEFYLELLDSSLIYHEIDDTLNILNISLDDVFIEIPEQFLIVPPVYKTHPAIKGLFVCPNIESSQKYIMQLK